MGRLNTVNQCYFRSWSPNVAYAFGYVWADGSVDSKYYYLRLNCNTEDEAIILAIRQNVNSNHKITREPPRPPGISPTTRCVICSKGLVAGLKELGVVHRKSELDLSFPFVPDDLLCHFVRGYFDGDGTACVSYTRHKEKVYDKLTVEYKGNKTFICELNRNLLARLPLNETNPGLCGESVWRTGWSARKDAKALYHWMYPSGDYIFGQRKRQLIEEYLGAA